MATYTNYYNLDKYEGSDRPNLRDQYNSAMDKIDAALHTQDGNITAAATVANNAATAAATATDAATAATAAATAAGEAATAATSTATAAASEAATATTAAATANSKAEQAIGLAGAGDIIVIGDSFSAGGEWANQVATATGRTVRNYAISGAGFIAGATTFSGQWQSAVNDGLEGASDIIVYGGLNDFYSSQSAAGTASAIINFATAVTSSSSALRLHICFCNIGYAQQAQYNGFSNWYSTVMRSLQDAGVRGLVPYVPYWHLNRPAMFGSDNAHPNSAGYKVIASYMGALLDGTYAGIDVLQVWPLMHGGVDSGTVFAHFVNGVLYVGMRASSTMTWTNVQNNQFLSVGSVGNGASQYSLMIGDGGVDSAWYFSPIFVFATGSSGSLCLVRGLFNAAGKSLWFQAFGDAGQLNNRTFDWNGENVSWTVMPVQK